jgi:hypothetical protein
MFQKPMASHAESSPASLQAPSIDISLYSYGRSNGPFIIPEDQKQTSILLSYNIRHLPNPPRNLRAMTTGLSPRLRKEFLKNDMVESFLRTSHDEIVNSLKTARDTLVRERGSFEASQFDVNGSGIPGDSKPDIPLLVTVCCEEGRHRSVAFVEELARRLSLLRGGVDVSRPWELSVTASHRDLGLGSDSMASRQEGGLMLRVNDRRVGKMRGDSIIPIGMSMRMTWWNDILVEV